MIKNYLVTALRNLRRNRLFSLINVLGLSIGISAALVIFLIVRYELSFEQFQPDKDRIYRVVTNMRFAGDAIDNSGVSNPLPDAIRREITGIETSTAFYTAYPKVSIPAQPGILPSSGGKPAVFKSEKNFTYADNNYFTLFPNYRWLAGSPEKALQEPNSAVLSKSRANLYFPGLSPADIIGKHIVYEDTLTTVVTGVIADLDKPTSLNFKEFVSLSSIRHHSPESYRKSTDWNSITSNSQCFLKLSPATKPAQIEAQLAVLRHKYAGKEEAGSHTENHLQPLTDIHFNSRYDALDQPQAHMPTLYGLMLVAVFLLLLGCINFINLTTAQASTRAREIGIRKTLGSSAKQLIAQFLGETFLLTLGSLLISLALTPWLLHIFSDFIPKDLHFAPLRQPGILLFLLALLILVTLLSGFYPALVLSRFKPVLVLKNQIVADTSATRRAWVRKGLTVFQFTIAQCFILAAIIVGRQIHYSINSDLGFRKEAIVTINTPWVFEKKDDHRFVFLQRLRALPGIEQACTGSLPPSDGGAMSQTVTYSDGKKNIPINLQIKYGDSNYFNLYRLKVLAGRAPIPSDTPREYVINETARRYLGFRTPADAVGKMLGGYTIAGVVADFHHASFRTPIQPLALASARNFEFDLLVALRPQTAGGTTWSATLAQAGAIYKQLFPQSDYNYQFLDESIAQFYTGEQNIARLLKWATGLTILVSCLGLAGLVIFTTNSRIKEIGIRKVLGASITGIAALLSRDFVKLLVIAFLIATPIAGWALNRWLGNYAYRAPLSWWIFPLAGLGMITIALLTISIRTIRSAMANPVHALRSE